MATVELLDLMTAEEFGKRPDPGCPEELVRGRVIASVVPDRRHGYVCLRAGRIIADFVEKHDLGRLMSNDSGVITERNPDSVRGADVAFYSYKRLPKGPLAPGYGPEVPELVVEVRSPSDRWRDIHEKITEYLNAGVTVVVVLDPGPDTAHVFSADDAPKILATDDELVLPGILDEFRVRVGEFFE
jgi:Uma2 family endonuclease